MLDGVSKDGIIKLCLNYFSLLFSRDELNQMFNERDRDFDGKLSFEEFIGTETKVEKAFKVRERKYKDRIICYLLFQEARSVHVRCSQGAESGFLTFKAILSSCV